MISKHLSDAPRTIKKGGLGIRRHRQGGIWGAHAADPENLPCLSTKTQTEMGFFAEPSRFCVAAKSGERVLNFKLFSNVSERSP